MKKRLIPLLALVMAVFMLLPVLASCSEEEAVSADSEEVSENASADSSKASETLVTEVSAKDPEYATNVALGRAYNSSADAGAQYPDTYGVELTDGLLGAEKSENYNQPNYSGYGGGGSVIFTIDLGEVYDNLYEFKLGYCSTRNAGIRPPSNVRISVSLDGKKFEGIGKSEIPEFVEGVRAETVYRSEYYVKARYVRFVVLFSGWFFADELQVFANTDKVNDIDGDRLENIKALYDKLGTVKYEGTKDKNEKYSLKLVSAGSKYTTTYDSLPAFKDDGKTLTDGKVTRTFNGGKWSGYEGGKEFAITVDLGKTRNDLSDFALVCYANNTIGNSLPLAVTYAISDDGKSFTDIGRIYGVACKQNVHDYALSLSKCVEARYIRFTIEATETESYIIEQAAVYAHTANASSTSKYPYPEYDHVDKEWDAPSGKEVNLVAGLQQSVYIPEDIVVQENNTTPANTTVLTDGIKGSNTDIDIHNGQYFKIHNSSSPIEIFFDLGATSTVKSVNVQFINRAGWGVFPPSSYDVYVSDNGIDWFIAGTCTPEPTSDHCLVDATLKLKKPVKARYISIYFMTNGWVGFSEIEVMGTTATKGVPSISEAKLPARGYGESGYLVPDEDLIMGYKDVCLLYHRVDRPGYSENELLRYLAYVDSEGNIKDTMFDSFLFLQSGDLPSGKANNDAITQSDLDWMLDTIFGENINLNAMEKVAGRIKDELGLDEDFKYGFAVTLYKPTIGSDYGDYNGDGVSDKINNEADRLAAMAAYMDQFEKRYAESGFKNIEFMGYYWYHEGIYPEHNDVEVLKSVSKETHKRGYDLFWIPWYNAPGVEYWKDCGIDVAVMQPGYVFDSTIPAGRIETAANFIRKYGMGIEIEIGWSAMNDPLLYSRYIEYLMGGIKYGYMNNCFHMYYQEVSVYYTASTSTDPKVRNIYDYTYLFIKGKLDQALDPFEPVSVTGSKNTVIVGKVTEKDISSYTFRVSEQPANGCVSIGSNGEFLFFPEKDFVGTVSFTYVYDSGIGESKPCTVEITVE